MKSMIGHCLSTYKIKNNKTNINTDVPGNLNWTDFCFNDESPEGIDAQAGLTDRMCYQSHVGRNRFISCTWYSIQSERP
jgi:hypothetical protein